MPQRTRGALGAGRREFDAFWDWAVLELLVQSGLRVEEACELTTLDVLKRRLADGRVYYMLHVQPSKFDRARVLPIGDGLGRASGTSSAPTAPITPRRATPRTGTRKGRCRARRT